jgi:hypothetical protein
MYARRKGYKYIKSEWRMQKQLLKIGIINKFFFIRNIFLRIPVRLLPARLIEWVYRNFARRKAG